MIHQTITRHLFILRSRSAVVAVRINRDAAARGEFAPYFDVFRVHELDQVIHDDVDAILVEVAMVAEAKQIELERLAFDHLDVRNVADVDGRKVRLSGNRAQAGEFRAIEFHEVIPVRMFVVKGLQHTRVVRVIVGGSLVAQESK